MRRGYGYRDKDYLNYRCWLLIRSPIDFPLTDYFYCLDNSLHFMYHNGKVNKPIFRECFLNLPYRGYFGFNAMRFISPILLLFLLTNSSFGQNNALPPVVPGASVQRVKKTIEFLSTDCFPRDYTHADNQLKAAKYIESHFKNAGLTIKREKYSVDKYTLFNIHAMKKGASRDRIIIGAHFDAVESTPGADDNASGIAGLIELAYLFKNVTDFPCDVELIAWNSEEPPLYNTPQMGSAVDAENKKKRKIKIKAVFCMDVIGYYSDKPGSQTYPFSALKYLYGDKGDFIGLLGNYCPAEFGKKLNQSMNQPGLKAQYLSVPALYREQLAFSDHRNYFQFERPTVFITNTAWYRNKAYHQKDDTPDTIDYKRVALIADGLYAFIRDYYRPEKP